MKVKAFVIAGLVALFGVFAISMTTGKTEVPKAVKEAFAKKYPTAKKVAWELEEAGEYEAEFKLNKMEMSANFKEDGTWLETEMEIKKSALPQAVKDAIAAQFAGYELEEAEQLEKPGAAMAYEVTLEDEANDTEMEVVFAADGTVLKQKVKKEDDDDDGNDDDDKQ